MPIATALALAFTVHATNGLMLDVAGVPVVRGSYFQYYESGWSKGYYNSLYVVQNLETFKSGVVRYAFRSNDGRAFGNVFYIPSPNCLRVEYQLNWSGERPVNVELTAGLLWAPAILAGTLLVGGKPQRMMLANSYPSTSGWTRRRYGAPTGSMVFEGALGTLSFASSLNDWTLIDGRGSDQDWAAPGDLLWLGLPGLEVTPGKTRHVSLVWRFIPRPQNSRTQTSVALFSKPLAVARAVDQPYPLVPKPKAVNLYHRKVYALGPQPKLHLPEGLSGTEQLFRGFYKGLWEPSRGHSGTITGKIGNLNLPPEGYQVLVDPQGVTVVGQSETGLLNGLYTLALMTYPQGGKLVVPHGEVRDWPSIDWRGIHMFVGPKALAFHRELFLKALRPLKINRVVLQCERTAWTSTPGIETSLTMPRDDLLQEFELMRRIGVEPIPLIQSFGHVEWLFANKKNADLALNADALYAIDPRKPKAQAMIRTIWDEAIGLLKPKTVHFGMDEVAMVGMKDDPSIVSDLWDLHLPFLMKIAADNQVQPMIWGDVGLSKNQAVDACNGDTPEHAKRRRDVIPANSLVGDWHYSPNPDPKAFVGSLALWKREGKDPIASTWYNPSNIRSFVLAAAQEGCGALQTTWAGFESDWESLYREFPQYHAYVTFADYAWSGRTDALNQRGYDPGRLLRRLLLDTPSSVTSKPGHALVTQGTPRANTRLGGYVFQLMAPIALRSGVETSQITAPTYITINCSERGKEIVFAVDCMQRSENGSPVATIKVVMSNGKSVSRTLYYGQDIRAISDPAAIVHADRSQKMSLIAMPLGSSETKVQKIVLRAWNVYSGFRLRGVTVY